MSDDRYADHDAAFEKDMDREVAEAEDVRLAGDDFPEWVETIRLIVPHYIETDLVTEPSPDMSHSDTCPGCIVGPALDSIVELYEWTEAAREQLNIDRIHEKRRAESATENFLNARDHAQRAEPVVKAAQAFLRLTHGDSEQKRALVLALDHYAYDRESGAAGTANESSRSVLPTSDTAAPENPTLFDQLPDPGDDRLGRFSNPALSGAPETQRVAAVQVYPKTGTQRRKVLDALAMDDLTDEQIESRIHIGQRQVSTRRKELELDGWIMDSEERRLSRAGFEVVVWTLTPAGRHQYASLVEEAP